MEHGQLEAALLETLVEDDEAARVPTENLHPVAALRDEDEEMAGEEILFPLAADDRRQAIDAVAHVARLSGEQNPDRLGKKQHRSAQRRDRLSHVRRVGADRKAQGEAAVGHLDQRLAVPRPRLRRGRAYDCDGKKTAR